MLDFKNVSATEALRYAKELSGLSAKELAEKTGISTGILNRYLNQNDEYSPSLEILPTLCIALKNDILIQWINSKIALENSETSPAKTRADVLTTVAYASSALGEVQRIVAEAQILYPWTAREIRSALEEVIAICRKAQAELQPLAERRDRDVVLASLSDGEQVPYTDTSTHQERTPWWKFWKRE